VELPLANPLSGHSLDPAEALKPEEDQVGELIAPRSSDAFAYFI